MFTTTTTTPGTPTATAMPTPTNVSPKVRPGCYNFYTETNQLCWQLVQEYSITLDDFGYWNGDTNVCNTLQPGVAYCTGGRPSNALPAAASSCVKWFNDTNLLCFEIAQQYGITVDQVNMVTLCDANQYSLLLQFESWNGGSGVCNVLQPGISYCVLAPTSTSPSVPTPTNAAPGIVQGCRKWYTETDQLCWQIAATYSITVDQVCSFICARGLD